MIFQEITIYDGVACASDKKRFLWIHLYLGSERSEWHVLLRQQTITYVSGYNKLVTRS